MTPDNPLAPKAMIDCAGCNGEQAPLVASTVENSRCLACHDPVAALAAKTRPKGVPEHTPHGLHHGDISCAVCHHAHSESYSYRLDCHRNFAMPMPGEAKE